MTIDQIKKDIAEAVCPVCENGKYHSRALPCPSCAHITKQDRVMKVVYWVSILWERGQPGWAPGTDRLGMLRNTYTALCELCAAEGWEPKSLPYPGKNDPLYTGFIKAVCMDGSKYPVTVEIAFVYLAAIAEEQGVQL